jgi:hypothetical protein
MKQWPSILFALAAMSLSVVLVWYMQRPAAPKQASWDDVVAEARAGGYNLISTEELADRYRANPASLMIIDTRQEWEYRTGHIKDAVNFPMEPTAWARWRKAGALEKFLGADRDRHLVFY